MNLHQFSFEKLKVWNLARELVKLVYQMTRTFPPEEKIGLVSQLTCSTISVCSNLAEGSTRQSPKDQAHFTNLSFSSLMELFNLLILAYDVGFIKENELSFCRQKIQNLSVRITNFKSLGSHIQLFEPKDYRLTMVQLSLNGPQAKYSEISQNTNP